MFNKLLRSPSVEALRRSTVAGNTGVMTVGIGVQLALQAGYFILVTRTMGVSAYGAFISVAALAALLGAFSGWGGDQILIRTVATTPSEFPRALGNALIFLTISAPTLIVIGLLLIPHLIDAAVPWGVVALIVVGDLLFTRLNTFAVNCFQAYERGRDMARLGILLNAVKAIAAVIWAMTTAAPDPLSWAWYYCGASVIAGIISIAEVFIRLGAPVWQVRWSDWKDGGFFALQMGSFVGFRDIDKPIVVALSSLPQAGLYAAAFRIADVAAVPVRALMYSTYVRFFRAGAHGTRGSLAFAKRLVPVGLLLGGLAGIGVALSSTFASYILGASQYAGIGLPLLILTPLPILYAMYYIGADALISGGHVGYRTAIQLGLPVIDVGLCLLLVPRYGALGAALATTLTHMVLVGIVWTSATLIARDEPPS